MRTEGKLKYVWIDSKTSKLGVKKTETGATTHIVDVDDRSVF
jgi:hypothetical protein